MDRTKQAYYRAKMKSAQKQIERTQKRMATLQKKMGTLQEEEQLYRQDLIEAQSFLQPEFSELAPDPAAS